MGEGLSLVLICYVALWRVEYWRGRARPSFLQHIQAFAFVFLSTLVLRYVIGGLFSDLATSRLLGEDPRDLLYFVVVPVVFSAATTNIPYFTRVKPLTGRSVVLVSPDGAFELVRYEHGGCRVEHLASGSCSKRLRQRQIERMMTNAEAMRQWPLTEAIDKTGTAGSSTH